MTYVKTSIYKLKNGKFQVSYYDKSKKKQVRRVFSSHLEAKIFEICLVTQIEHGKENYLDQDRALKVKELIEQHYKERPKTRLSEMPIALKAFMTSFSQKEIYEIRSHDLLYWFIDFQKKRSLSEKTLCRIKSQLNHFFKYLVEGKYIELNPLDLIKFKQNLPSKRDRIILSPTEISDFLNKVRLFVKVQT